LVIVSIGEVGQFSLFPKIHECKNTNCLNKCKFGASPRIDRSVQVFRKKWRLGKCLSDATKLSNVEVKIAESTELNTNPGSLIGSEPCP
jgi:hypothetical protein